MIKEEWRPIDGYKYYEVSNWGRVRSLDRMIVYSNGRKHLHKGHILTPCVKKSKHCVVQLYRNCNKAYVLVHRIVYEAFVGSIPEGMQVNHIDENPMNNCVWNLNLMTPKENTNWGTGIVRRAKKCSETMKGQKQYEKNNNAKPIVQYDLDGNYIDEYFCAKYAIEKFNLSQSSLSSNLNGKTKSCGGYVWKFKRDAV